MLTGINIVHFKPRGDYTRQIEPSMGGVEQSLDLAEKVRHNDHSCTLSDGSPALNLFVAICKKVGYQPMFYKVKEEPGLDGPELARSVDELDDRSSQRGASEDRSQEDILSAKIIFEFMPWRTVAFGSVGVLLGLLLARVNPSGGGVVHQLQ